jgi:hypothetical protein
MPHNLSLLGLLGEQLQLALHRSNGSCQLDSQFQDQHQAVGSFSMGVANSRQDAVRIAHKIRRSERTRRIAAAKSLDAFEAAVALAMSSDSPQI